MIEIFSLQRKIINGYKIVAEKARGNGDAGFDEMIILNGILEEWYMMIWIRFIWQKLGASNTSGGLL